MRQVRLEQVRQALQGQRVLLVLLESQALQGQPVLEKPELLDLQVPLARPALPAQQGLLEQVRQALRELVAPQAQQARQAQKATRESLAQPVLQDLLDRPGLRVLRAQPEKPGLLGLLASMV